MSKYSSTHSVGTEDTLSICNKTDGSLMLFHRFKEISGASPTLETMDGQTVLANHFTVTGYIKLQQNWEGEILSLQSAHEPKQPV